MHSKHFPPSMDMHLLSINICIKSRANNTDVEKENYCINVGKKINDINCLIYSGIYKQTQIAQRQIRVFFSMLMNFSKFKLWWNT